MPNPRQALLQDPQKRINDRLQTENLVLMIDTNEDQDSVRITYKNLVEDLGLFNVIHEEEGVPSTLHGSAIIYHIETGG